MNESTTPRRPRMRFTLEPDATEPYFVAEPDLVGNWDKFPGEARRGWTPTAGMRMSEEPECWTLIRDTWPAAMAAESAHTPSGNALVGTALNVLLGHEEGRWHTYVVKLVEDTVEKRLGRIQEQIADVVQRKTLEEWEARVEQEQRAALSDFRAKLNAVRKKAEAVPLMPLEEALSYIDLAELFDPDA